MIFYLFKPDNYILTCIDKVKKETTDWVSLQKDKSWSQQNTSGVTLNADLETKTHHQTPVTCTYGYSYFSRMGTVMLQQRWKYNF